MLTIKPSLYYEPYTRILSTDPIKNFKYKFEISNEDVIFWKILYIGDDHFLKIDDDIEKSIIRLLLISPDDKKYKYKYEYSDILALSRYND